jgi:hypothetical protein
MGRREEGVWGGRKQERGSQHSGSWSRHCHSDKPTSSRMSVWPRFTQPHWDMLTTLSGEHRQLRDCRQLLHRVTGAILGRGLACRAAKVGVQELVIKCDPLFPLLFLPFLHLYQTKGMGWLFSKSKPVSFFKIEISQVISLPHGPLPLERMEK